ncbi:GLPGLI family protein [Pedobacter sp. Du54]|uniref:GLPGLI family protein n=1 Tax=Pedobacter anseongensis TaxID=3133439 RepID=UPI00309C5FB4
MKKYLHYLLLLSLIMIVQKVNAQLKLDEPILVSVQYEFVHVNDLNHRDLPIREMMMLQTGQTLSKYRKASYPKSRSSGNPPRPKTVQQKGNPNLGTAMAVVFGPGFTTEELFQFPNENKISILETKGNYDYQVDISLPKINWKIYEETREIGIYTCQKAIGEFSGRTYVAWFAPELPFKNGPWKLSGLPGLILEAKDTKDEVLFLFKSCTKQVAGAKITTSKENLIKVSEKAYGRLKSAFDENPVVALRAQFSNTGDRNFEVAYRDATGLFVSGEEAEELVARDKKLAKMRKNNPIELK